MPQRLNHIQPNAEMSHSRALIMQVERSAAVLVDDDRRNPLGDEIRGTAPGGIFVHESLLCMTVQVDETGTNQLASGINRVKPPWHQPNRRPSQSGRP